MNHNDKHHTQCHNSTQEQSQESPNPHNIISGFSHSFDTGIAFELGLHSAIIFNHIVYWLRQNASKKDAEAIEGKFWMYETQKEMSEFLGYMTLDEVKKAIVKLLDHGLLIKGNFNKNPFDRTNWYTVYDQGLITNYKIKKTLTKEPCGTIHSSPGHDPKRPMAPSYYKETQENTYTKTTTSTTDADVVHNSKKQETAKALKSYIDNRISEWGQEWQIPLQVYFFLIDKHNEAYVSDQVSHMISKQNTAIRDENSYDPTKKKSRRIEKPENYLRLACEKNYALSQNTKR